MAGIRPRGHGPVLFAAAARVRLYQGDSQQDSGRRHGLAYLQRSQARVEGLTKTPASGLPKRRGFHKSPSPRPRGAVRQCFPTASGPEQAWGHQSKGGPVMRTSLTAALEVSVFSLYGVSAVAQHHSAKQKAEKPKSDAELIASALSAAPAAVSKDATIVAVGP